MRRPCGVVALLIRATLNTRSRTEAVGPGSAESEKALQRLHRSSVSVLLSFKDTPN